MGTAVAILMIVVFLAVVAIEVFAIAIMIGAIDAIIRICEKIKDRLEKKR